MSNEHVWVVGLGCELKLCNGGAKHGKPCLWGLQLSYSVPLIFLLLQVIVINFFLNSSKKKKQYCNVYWAKIDDKIATFPQRKSLFFSYNLKYVNGYSIALVKKKLNEPHCIEKQKKQRNKYSFNWLQKKKLINYNTKLNFNQSILALVN